jgi:protein-disulfide isomerase
MTRSNVVLAISFTLAVIAVTLAAVALIRVTDAGTPGGQTMSTSFGAQVRNYLLDNPEVLFEAAQAYEERQQAVVANELTVAIQQNREELFNNTTSPVTGNPDGDVTIVEFFDYNCPYCRKAVPILAEMEASDRGLRIVFKEFPILGPGSEFAARAALASRKQGKYVAFHKAMMGYAGKVDEGSVIEVAAGLGLDVEQLKKDMDDPAIAQAIAGNLALAEKLRINGTPGFVAGKEIVSGLAPLRSMKELIVRAREQ